MSEDVWRGPESSVEIHFPFRPFDERLLILCNKYLVDVRGCELQPSFEGLLSRSTMASKFLILVGGYSTYIYTLLFDPASSSLTSLARSSGASSPSWITKGPSNIVYATSEVMAAPGTLYSFTLDRRSGNLTLQSSVDTLAREMRGGTVHIATLEGGNAVMTTNYFSGSVFYAPLESDKVTFAKTGQQLVTFTGKGPYPQQDMSHPHEVCLAIIGIYTLN